MAWFEYDQNNSYGKFEIDDVLCHELWIEAETLEDANRQFLDMGGYFDGVEAGIDCGCCGDRWSPPYREGKFPLVWDREGTVFNTIEDYILHLVDMKWSMRNIYRLFYANGDMREFKKEDGKIIERLVLKSEAA